MPVPSLLDPGTPPPLPQAPLQAGPPQMQGMPNGLLGGPIADPTLASYYAPPQDPRVAEIMHGRQMAAMAGAFGQAAQPTPYRTGLLNFIGSIGPAANAYAQGGDPLIQARTQAAQGELYGAQAQTSLATMQAHQVLAALGQQLAGVSPGGGGTGAGAGAGSGTSGPGTNQAPKLLDKAKGQIVDFGDPRLNLIAYHESGYRPNVGTGEHDLSGYQLNQNGFPMWPGIQTDKGRSTAAGYFQITGTNWNRYAPALIASGAMKPDFSAESQIAVAKAMMADSGMSPWLPFNSNLREAYNRGDVIKVPGGPGSTDVAAAPVPAGGGQPRADQAGTAAAVIGNRARLGANAPAPTTQAAAPPIPPAPGGLLQPRPPIALQGTAAGVLGRPRMGGSVPAPAVGSGGGAPPVPPPSAGGVDGLITGQFNPMAQNPSGPQAAPAPPAGPPGPQNAPAAPAPAPAPSGPPAAPAAAPGPNLAQAQPGPMPMPPPVSIGPTAAQQGPIPGAPTPEQVRIAQQMVAVASPFGIPLSPVIQSWAKFPMIEPEAAAKARGEAAAQQPYTQANQAQKAQMDAQWQVWAKAHEPILSRPNTLTIDPNTGNVYGQFDAKGPDGTIQRFVSTPNPQGGAPIIHNYGQPQLTPEEEAAQKARGGLTPVTIAPKAGGQGPGFTEPLTTRAGTVVPPASQATPITGNQEYLNQRSKDYATTEKTWGDSTQGAAETVNRVETIMSIMHSYQTGSWATEKSDLIAKAQSVGIDLSNAANNPAAAQQILKLSFDLALNQMKATGLSRWTQNELSSSLQNLAQPNLRPEANLAIGAKIVGTLAWEQQMQRDFAESKKYNASGYNDPQDFQQRWVQANPLQPFVTHAEKAIGTLQGMPGGPSTPPAAPSSYPHGTIQIGTSQGKPVYELPSGKQVW